MESLKLSAQYRSGYEVTIYNDDRCIARAVVSESEGNSIASAINNHARVAELEDILYKLLDCNSIADSYAYFYEGFTELRPRIEKYFDEKNKD